MEQSLKLIIQQNAEEIRRLHRRIHTALRTRDRSPEEYEAWKAACAEFHQRYDALAFPGGYTGALDRILSGDVNSIEAALCFVETRPFFFRSGYMYKDLLRKLKHAPIDAANAKRLESILQAYAEYRRQRRQRTSTEK